MLNYSIEILERQLEAVHRSIEIAERIGQEEGIKYYKAISVDIEMAIQILKESNT